MIEDIQSSTCPSGQPCLKSVCAVMLLWCVNNMVKKKKKKVECYLVWCLTDMVFEEDIKGSSLSFIFPSWNWFNAYTHAHVHTPLSTHLFTYRQKIRWEKKTSAPSSEEPSQINFFPVRPLMHLHLSPLTYSLPPPAFVCSFLSPPVLALRTEKLFLLFSVCVSGPGQ